jgi:hypothetical protein
MYMIKVVLGMSGVAIFIAILACSCCLWWSSSRKDVSNPHLHQSANEVSTDCTKCKALLFNPFFYRSYVYTYTIFILDSSILQKVSNFEDKLLVDYNYYFQEYESQGIF